MLWFRELFGELLEPITIISTERQKDKYWRVLNAEKDRRCVLWKICFYNEELSWWSQWMTKRLSHSDYTFELLIDSQEDITLWEIIDYDWDQYIVQSISPLVKTLYSYKIVTWAKKL